MTFEKRAFGEFASFRYGKMPNKNRISDNGKYPIFSGYRITGYYDEYNLEENELVIVARGVGGTGNVKLSPAICYLTNLSIAVEMNEEIALKKYLYYYFAIRNLRYLDSGSAQSQITISDLEKVVIPIPDMEEQKKIVAVLSSIDEKIKQNTAINENLEQQAQAYFIDLFITNANPDWKIGTISDLGNVVGGGTPSKKVDEYYTSSGIAWITPKDLSNDKSKFVAHGATDITELGLAKSSATLMPKGTVLFSSRAPIGYIAIADGQVSTNQGFKSIVPFDNVGTAFIYYFLKENLTAIENVASGSTFKEVSGSTLKNFGTVIPDNEILAEFQHFCTPLFEQQQTLEYESRYLANLRDTLLPKLMNGEIVVSEVKI